MSFRTTNATYHFLSNLEWIPNIFLLSHNITFSGLSDYPTLDIKQLKILCIPNLIKYLAKHPIENQNGNSPFNVPSKLVNDVIHQLLSFVILLSVVIVLLMMIWEKYY